MADALESKLHRLAKNQDGGWRITVNTHPSDVLPDWLLRAAPGQRLGVAIVPIDDERQDAALASAGA